PGHATPGHISGNAVTGHQDSLMRDRCAGNLLKHGEAALINRSEGFAEIDDLATGLLVAFGDGAGAPEAFIPAVHDDVGIGAEKRQIPALPLRNLWRVIVGVMMGLITETRDQHRIGGLDRTW